MFSSDKNIEILTRLVRNLRRYGELRWAALRLDFVGKMTVLLSALIVAGVLFCLAALMVVFLSFAVVHLLAPKVGLAAAYGWVAAGYLLLAILVFAMRRRLIVNPIARFFTALFLDEELDGETPDTGDATRTSAHADYF